MSAAPVAAIGAAFELVGDVGHLVGVPTFARCMRTGRQCRPHDRGAQARQNSDSAVAVGGVHVSQDAMYRISELLKANRTYAERHVSVSDPGPPSDSLS